MITRGIARGPIPPAVTPAEVSTIESVYAPSAQTGPSPRVTEVIDMARSRSPLLTHGALLMMAREYGLTADEIDELWRRSGPVVIVSTGLVGEVSDQALRLAREAVLRDMIRREDDAFMYGRGTQ